MIKPLKRISIAIVISSSCFYCSAYAQESSSPDLTMGFNYSVNFQAYKGHKTSQTLLPVFSMTMTNFILKAMMPVITYSKMTKINYASMLTMMATLMIQAANSIY